jgi:hypothetical protein
MIDISRPGNNPKIRLTPRPGFRTKKALEFDLIYGHKCPFCSNVITACFKTEQKIDLFPYEETSILSQGEKNRGELLKTVPNRKDPDGCYRSEHFGKGADGIQRLLMKNHIMHASAIESRSRDESGESLWEPGERPCMYAGVFSEREDLLIKDLLLLFKFHPTNISSYNIPKVKEIIPDPAGDPEAGQFRWIPAIGDAPPVVLSERNYIKGGMNYFLSNLMKPFTKTNPK